MTTTTGDPSTLKSPASLSGGDLVSRLLAATPPYLYNVPLTPHSFFFSEMLRSFVQAKAEASSAGGGGGGGSGSAPNAPRRRKRSWRDARDRPLELTTKERPHHHHHHHYHQHSDKYYHSSAQQQAPQVPPETRLENDVKRSDAYLDTMENKVGATFDQKPNFGGDILKPIDENKTEFPRHGNKSSFFDERPRHLEQAAQPPENILPGGETRKVKPEDSQQQQQQQQQQHQHQHLDRNGGRNCNFDGGRSYEDRSKSIALALGQEVSPLQVSEQKKLDLSRAGASPFLPGMPMPGRGCEGVLQGVKGFPLPGGGGVSNPAEFLPGPLWYPPYPMPQSYPGIDPLHFFIDLRVSGHIWDRKHASERQLSFKSKHSSAFSVPQSKECAGNRPLNLTRDEATTSKNLHAENTQGTNYILKHLMKTYQDIQQIKTCRTDASMENEENSKETQQAGEGPAKVEEPGSTTTNSGEERKDLRALIGLELVVDYVKEPKDDSSSEQTSRVTE